MQKGFSAVILLVGILIMVALGGAYYIGQQSTNKMVDLHQEWMPEANIPSPTSDPTADWKTYTNQQLQISFKYPPLMKDPKVNLISTRTQILIDNYAIEDGFFYDQSLQRKLTFDEVVKMNSLDGNGISDYNMGVISGKKVVNKAQEVIVVQPSKSQPDNIIIIYFNLDAHPAVQEEFLDSILKTFKFTDQTSKVDATSWKTYTNSYVKFSIQYPPTWTLTEVKAPAGYNPTQFPGGISRIDLKGIKGGIAILWGGGFGGGPCPQTHYQLHVDAGIIDFCDTVHSDNSESLNTSNDGSANATSQNTRTNTQTTFAISSDINSPYQISRTEILQILSTFKFTN